MDFDDLIEMLYIDILFFLDLNVIGFNCMIIVLFFFFDFIFEVICLVYEVGKELILVL